MILISGLITLLLVLAIGVVAAPLLSRVLRHRAAHSRTGPRFITALRPDFGQFSIPRATTQTFNLLISSMVVFGLMLVGWATGAGIMRAVWLLSGSAQAAPGTLLGLPPALAACGAGCGLTWLVILTQLVRAIGGVLAIAAAAGMAGALLGFIFGIPRPVSASETPPAAAGGIVPAAGASTGAAKRAWALSTNLTQVSDWLTKIIVGVGLVEAHKVFGAFTAISNTAALWLFGMRHGSPTLIGACILGSTVFGFLFAYLYTQLIIARLIAATDSDLDPRTGAAEAKLHDMNSWSESLVPRISRSRLTPDTIPSPSQAQIGAALALNAVSFEDLLNRSDLTEDTVRSWARARAVLNDYPGAARGYTYVLGMPT